MIDWLVTYAAVCFGIAVLLLMIGLSWWYSRRPPIEQDLEPMSNEWRRQKALHSRDGR